MTEKIVVLDPISQERADELRELLPEGFILECGQGFSDEDLKDCNSRCRLCNLRPDRCEW